jgi:hypothetical protein
MIQAPEIAKLFFSRGHPSLLEQDCDDRQNSNNRHEDGRHGNQLEKLKTEGWFEVVVRWMAMG